MAVKAEEGMKEMAKEDASLSDMYTFSKVIANGKTPAQELAEEKA